MSDEPAKKFTVIRDKWIRGGAKNNAGASMLYRPADGKKCCLGFYLESCGVALEDMKELAAPAGVMESSQIPSWLLLEVGTGVPVNSPKCQILMRYNDHEEETEDAMPEGTFPEGTFTEEKRERRIAETFLSMGVTVEFK